jgi:predicted Zn-dependent peptidase
MMKKIKTKKLKNGITIVSVPTDSPSVTVMALVNTGSYFEEKSVNGISHFLEHMCFKGTHKKSGKEIMRYLDGLGAETNAFTSNEYTGYYVKSITKHWKRTLAVVSDIFLNSTFPEEEMQKEKGVIIGEISMYEDMPMRHVHDLFSNLIYGDQPAGRTILGTRKNITNMERKKIVTYHSEHYVAEATTIIVAGKVEHADVVDHVTKNFKSILSTEKSPKKKVVNVQSSLRMSIHHKKTDQTHIVLGHRSYGFHHKDAIILKVIASTLGGGMSSRLFEKLREDMGVGYYVHAGNVANSDTGILEISCGVDSKRVPEVLSAISLELLCLTKELVPTEELQRIQEYIIGNTQMALESTDERAYYYGKLHLLGLEVRTPKDIAKKIKSVTAQDIRRVARNIIKNDRLNITMIGPHTNKETQKFKKALRH